MMVVLVCPTSTPKNRSTIIIGRKLDLKSNLILRSVEDVEETKLFSGSSDIVAVLLMQLYSLADWAANNEHETVE